MFVDHGSLWDAVSSLLMRDHGELFRGLNHPFREQGHDGIIQFLRSVGGLVVVGVPAHGGVGEHDGRKPLVPVGEVVGEAQKVGATASTFEPATPSAMNSCLMAFSPRLRKADSRKSPAAWSPSGQRPVLRSLLQRHSTVARRRDSRLFIVATIPR